MRKLILLLMLTLIGMFLLAQENPKSQLVGHWVAVNRSKGGIGSMWEFKPDGTLTMAPGAVVDMPYKLEGDTLTLPPETTGADAKPQIAKIKFDGNTMYQESISQDDPRIRVRFTRITTYKHGDPPLVGEWKLVDSSADKGLSEMQHAYANATYTYTRDGQLKLRIPFLFMNGTYDEKARTFTLKKTDGTVFNRPFRLKDGKLYLTPPAGRSEDVYIRDDND